MWLYCRWHTDSEADLLYVYKNCEMQNLVPPSHFDKDSRDGSPQVGMGKITPTTSSQKVGSGLTKPVLKTPDDFSPSSAVLVDSNQPVQRKVFPSTYLPPILPHRVVSQDSGLGWDQPKSNFGSNDNLQSLLNELKAENNQLHELIKQNLSEKVRMMIFKIIADQKIGIRTSDYVLRC